jgi:hypothetical protein
MLRKPLPSRADWFKEWHRTSSWLFGFIQALTGIIALIITIFSELVLWMRIVVALGLLLLPVLIYIIWIISLRLRQYTELYSRAEAAEREVEQLKQYVSFLFQSSLNNRKAEIFEVVTAIKRGDNYVLLIGPQHKIPEGSKVLVGDPSDGDTLGLFTVKGHTKEGHLAYEERIENAIWWGSIHQEVDKHLRPRINAVAVLQSNRDGER